MMMKRAMKKNLAYQINETAIPLILSSVVSILMGWIDQAFIGHISIYAYAGVGLVLSCINSLVGVLGAFSIVFNISGSKLAGEKNYRKLKEKFSVFIIICLFIGSLLACIFNLFCESILQHLFGLKGEVLKEAGVYLKIYSLSIPLNLIIFILSGVLKIFKKTKYLFLCTISVNVVNIFLDYVLVFGVGIFPEMGTLGAGIGTVLSLLLNVIIYYGMIRKYLKFSLSIPHFVQNIKRTILSSLPFIGQEIMEDIIFVVGINTIVARIGVLELSVYNLIMQIVNIFLMPMFGYATANTVFVSESYGKKEKSKILKITGTTFQTLLVWFALLYIILTLGRSTLAGFITEDMQVIKITEKMLPLVLFIHLPNYYLNICKSTLQSLGYEKWTLFVTFFINLFSLVVIFLIGKNLVAIYAIMGMGYSLISVFYSVKILKIKQKNF